MKLGVGQLSYEICYSPERLYVNKREVICICHHAHKQIFFSSITTSNQLQQILSHLTSIIATKVASKNSIFTDPSQCQSDFFYLPLPTMPHASITTSRLQKSDNKMLFRSIASHTAELLSTATDDQLSIVITKILRHLAQTLYLTDAIFLTPQLEPLFISNSLSSPIISSMLHTDATILQQHRIYYRPAQSAVYLPSLFCALDMNDQYHRGRLLLLSNQAIPFSRPAIHLYLTIGHIIASLIPISENGRLDIADVTPHPAAPSLPKT
ncbi:hypothetical protein [Poriferisphaera sp. WC338]|uniref:hypothetical protein n=1 Tax=Poriferisphaera sp. WC338 TaxID=3425129 RepID=UPI003D819D65